MNETFLQRCLRFSIVSLTVIVVPTFAQDYPSKVIRIVTPAPPGGSGDNYARLLAKELQLTWERGVIVDNRPGATGMIATNLVRQSQADGYTLLFTANSQHVVSPLLRNPRPFDPIADFTPITMLVKFPQFLVVNPALPVHSVRELIEYAKANPGRLRYASVGTGSNSHLVGELFNAAAGIDTVHIPYKGAAPSQLAVISGEAHYRFDNVGTSYPHVQSGKLRGLAVTAARRTPAARDIPTMTEAGLPGIEVYTWLGLFAPAQLPAPLLAKLSGEVSRVVSSASFGKRAAGDGYEVVGSTPEQFRKDLTAELAATSRIVAERKISAQ
jgi:tripartite-type tricarboxylate transporter receptor subunit TctC